MDQGKITNDTMLAFGNSAQMSLPKRKRLVGISKEKLMDMFKAMRCQACGMVPVPEERYICSDGHLLCAPCGDERSIKHGSKCMVEAVGSKNVQAEVNGIKDDQAEPVIPVSIENGMVENAERTKWQAKAKGVNDDQGESVIRGPIENEMFGTVGGTNWPAKAKGVNDDQGESVIRGPIENEMFGTVGGTNWQAKINGVNDVESVICGLIKNGIEEKDTAYFSLCQKRLEPYPADPLFTALWMNAKWKCPYGCGAVVSGKLLRVHFQECKGEGVYLE